MKTRLTVPSALLLAVVLPGIANAAFLSNWQLNLDGDSDASNAKTIGEIVDINGTTFIDNEVTGNDLTFEAWGAFKASGTNGIPGSFGDNEEFTATLNATGTGTLGGDLSFNSGVVKFYSDASEDFGGTNEMYGADNGTEFAELGLDSGEAIIDSSGIPNGNITLSFIFNSLEPNYIFDEDGNDLSGSVGSISQLVFGFATTNASRIDTPDTNEGYNFVPEVVEGFAGFNGSEALNVDGDPGNLIISNNGSLRLEVPEPGSLFLLGSGLLALAGIGRGRMSRHTAT